MHGRQFLQGWCLGPQCGWVVTRYDLNAQRRTPEVGDVIAMRCAAPLRPRASQHE